MFRFLVTLTALATTAFAWTSPSPQTRQGFLQTAVASATGAVLIASAPPALADETLPNGVKIVVKEKGSGPQPVIGDLAAIRFSAYAGNLKIDDIFDTPEPYYTRVGGGGLIKGVEAVLPMMRVGDRWVLTIPGDLAFGPKGRKPSPGTPRIPPNTEVTFDVAMVGLPGKEQELIELIGDD